MNTRAINSAAGVILAAVQQGRVPAGIALALDAAGLLNSPEHAAEFEHLRQERDGFRDQRNVVFATNEDLLAQVEASGLARLNAENEARVLARSNRELRERIAELEAERAQARDKAVDKLTALLAPTQALQEGEAP
ncbi:hypothetical protein [Streptomyces fractus]|uniref:hypothetical protein n=1 Tax=Streptomyces fractus TaxID=641806 RepID=UPI003CEFCABC